MGMVAWTIAERFSLQAQLGAGRYDLRWNQEEMSMEGQFRGGLLWSGDAKLVILDMLDTSFAADVQAGGWSWMEGPMTVNAIVATKSAVSSLRYWQIGLALTQRISLFSPYIGFAVNRTRFKLTHLPFGSGWMHARHVLGPFGGCSFSSGSFFLLNCEWRGWFEEGLSLSAQVRF